MKRISILTFLLFVNITIAQRGVKIGYIDTEYILENLTEYSEVSDRLEEKALGWKDEISQRSREIDQKKESLNTVRPWKVNSAPSRMRRRSSSSSR